jgi:hypothetical protein
MSRQKRLSLTWLDDPGSLEFGTKSLMASQRARPVVALRHLRPGHLNRRRAVYSPCCLADLVVHEDENLLLAIVVCSRCGRRVRASEVAGGMERWIRVLDAMQTEEATH